MMKILCAVALSLAATTVAALPSALPLSLPLSLPASASAPHPAPDSARATPTFATWHMADLQDVTQAWYFTGEALAGQGRDGAPWAGDRPIVRPADAVLAAPPLAAAPVGPTQVTVPPTIPEPHMASMLLVGLVLIFLRANHREEAFGLAPFIAR